MSATDHRIVRDDDDDDTATTMQLYDMARRHERAGGRATEMQKNVAGLRSQPAAGSF